MPRSPTERFLVHDSPYGGFSLRARTVEAAWGKIEAFLDAVATDVEERDLDLEVAEPCERSVAEAICGRPLHDTDAAGTRTPEDLPALLAATGHRFGATTAAAVERFGMPTGAGYGTDHPRPEYDFDPIRSWASWRWTRSPGAPSERAAVLDFAIAHAEERLPCWHEHVVTLVRHVTFRARDGGLEGALLAHLHGKASSVSLDLRWPNPTVDAAFVAFYDRVNASLGVKIPESRWKIGIIGPSGNLTFRKLGFSQKDWA